MRCAPCGISLSRRAPIRLRIYSIAMGEKSVIRQRGGHRQPRLLWASTEKKHRPRYAHLRSTNGHKVHATLGCDRTDKHRLAAPGRPTQQHALWRAHTEMREPLAVHEGPFDTLTQAGDRASESADIGEADRGRGDGVRAQRRRTDGGKRSGKVRCCNMRRLGGLRRG